MTEPVPQSPLSPEEVLGPLLSDETWAVSAYERLLAREDVEEISHKLRYCLSSHEARRQALLEELGHAGRRHASASDPPPSYQPLDAQADLEPRRLLDTLSTCESAALERCRQAMSGATGRVHELLSMRILPAQVQTYDIVSSLTSAYRATHDSIA